MWEIKYPIGKIMNFSHSLSLEPTPWTAQFADYGSGWKILKSYRRNKRGG